MARLFSTIVPTRSNAPRQLLLGMLALLLTRLALFDPRQIVALLSVHRVDEVPDLDCDLISVPETRRILMLRRDLGELSIQRIVEWMGQQAESEAASKAASAES